MINLPKKKLKMIEGPILISMAEFLDSYNGNIPPDWPHASSALLKKFKEEHPSLFTHGDLWSLDQHRKKLMDWLPRNTE